MEWQPRGKLLDGKDGGDRDSFRMERRKNGEEKRIVIVEAVEGQRKYMVVGEEVKCQVEGLCA